MGKKKDNQLIIYETKDGKIDVRFNLDHENVWLSLNQIAILFGRDKSVISRHIKNILIQKS
jgi:DNA ligase (NAD+)